MPSLKSTSSALLSLLLIDSVRGKTLTAVNDTQPLTGFAPCDALLAAHLPVHLPSSPIYQDLVDVAWTLDTRRHPWCFVLPSTTDEVSQVIGALQAAGQGAGDWHVAIRSGGHGSDHLSSITDGVTIDLSQLNASTYDATTNIAGVGTGARWGNVYADLEEHGVSVTGGREGVVGVGGLTLGGGISWYSARTGFACDSVVNYEVVLSCGTVINANATSHSDLWRALKGGSSNFGIVTRFDFEAFPAHNLTRQDRFIDTKHVDDFIDAFVGFTDLDSSFHDNAMIGIFTYSPENQDTTIMVREINTMADDTTTAFDAFDRIPTLQPPVKELMTLSQSSNSSQLPDGSRNAGAGTITIANDARVIRYCIEEYNKLVTDLKAYLGPKNFQTIMDFQPFPSYFAEFGGGNNMLGLDPNSRNKALFAPGVTLLSPDAAERQYPRVYQQVSAMNQRIEAFSRSVGADEGFVYLPYADASQDPIGSYGAANIRHMRRVADKYDPRGFFQRMVPGGFKISRVG